MKKIMVCLLVVFSLNYSSEAKSKSPSDLACEVVLCAVGLTIAESRSKCLKVMREWNIYLAKNPHKSKPKCKLVSIKKASL